MVARVVLDGSGLTFGLAGAVVAHVSEAPLDLVLVERVDFGARDGLRDPDRHARSVGHRHASHQIWVVADDALLREEIQVAREGNRGHAVFALVDALEVFEGPKEAAHRPLPIHQYDFTHWRSFSLIARWSVASSSRPTGRAWTLVDRSACTG